MNGTGIHTRRAKYRLLGKRLGVLLCGAGLGLLVFGGGMQLRRGSKRLVSLEPGSRLPLSKQGLVLRIHSFAIKEDSIRTGKEYETVVELLENDTSVVKRGGIKVNHPLAYRSLRIYQSGYQVDPFRIREPYLWIDDTQSDREPFTGFFTYQETMPVQRLGIFVRADSFQCDFAMDQATGRVYSRSLQHRNPAVRLSINDKHGQLEQAWVLRRTVPDHARRHRYQCKLISYQQIQHTVLLLCESPGSLWILAGMALFTMGLPLVLYTAIRKNTLNRH